MKYHIFNVVLNDLSKIKFLKQNDFTTLIKPKKQIYLLLIESGLTKGVCISQSNKPIFESYFNNTTAFSSGCSLYVK